MKKVLLFITIIILLSGCNKNNKTNKIDIELEGNPTTGYEWTCTSNNNETFDITKTYSSNTTDPKITGSGGIYTFTITGKKEGEAILTCNYKRSWEETEYDETKTYNVTVDKELNVTYR